VAVRSKKFEKLVHPRKHVAQVRKLLAERKIALPGKEGRLVSQIMVEGFGSAVKPYFIRLRLDRLNG
jgi:hypothetical protein